MQPLIEYKASLQQHERPVGARRIACDCIRLSPVFAHRIALPLDPMRVVDQPVTYASGSGRIAELLASKGHRQRRNENQRADLVTVLANLPEVTTLWFGKWRHGPPSITSTSIRLSRASRLRKLASARASSHFGGDPDGEGCDAGFLRHAGLRPPGTPAPTVGLRASSRKPGAERLRGSRPWRAARPGRPAGDARSPRPDLRPRRPSRR